MSEAVEKSSKPIAVWLFIVAFLVFGMVAVGGLTRLTESGLSMVEWKPVTGVIPPLNESDWLTTFHKYQQYPEFQRNRPNMTLGEFKFIFLMEFFHRLLGRLVGLVFFFPFLFFIIRKQLTRKQILQYGGLFLLGGLQGFVGWYMVKSGLVDEPRVSHFRLVMHLSLAIITLSISFWLGLTQLKLMHDRPKLCHLRKFALVVFAILTFQIITGGFVAGLRAGLAFNTFPTMNGEWIPAGIWAVSPWFDNFLHNPVMIQFMHRTSAYLVILAVGAFYIMAERHVTIPRLKIATHLLPVLLVLQVGLGIATLLMRVPVSLASLHQIGAILLWTNMLYLYHQFYTPKPEPS